VGINLNLGGRFKLLEVYPPPEEEGIKKRPKGKEQLILLRSERDASLDSHPLAAH